MPAAQRQTGATSDTLSSSAATLRSLLDSAPVADQNIGTGTSFIGGGCCVTLAVEYAASTATAAFEVVVLVKDSEGTLLGWGRTEPAGTPYRIHECIITTKPGATLTVEAVNCTARVRWCEVFSCC